LENLALSVLHKIDGSSTPTSLSGWCDAYLALVVQGSSAATLEAKKRDLRLFLQFADTIGIKNRAYHWTPSLSKSFQEHMLGHYSPSTVSRTMATLGHFARWLTGRMSFPAGNPMEGVQSIKLDEPSWNGLSKREIFQLKMAVDIRLASCKRQDQNPLLEAAVFYLLLYTGLRESELVNLNFDQYKGDALLNVRRKGQRISKKILVPKEAALHVNNYLADMMRKPDDPLFTNRGGNRLHRIDVINICKRLSLLTPDRVKLTPHMLRHTFLKRITDKHGVHIAQKLSGNVSIKGIFRYAKPSETESMNVVEALF
jgi:integrase/recombinase XerD